MQDLNTKVIVKIEIPKDLYNIYERQAQQSGKPLEELLSIRLDHCKWHTSLNPIYLDDEFRSKLESLLSHSIKSARDLVGYLSKTQELRLNGGIRVSLSDALLKRLQTRRFGFSLEKIITREAIRGLESYVGLR